MMSTLSSCQPPPPAGWVSLVEYEARFVALPPSMSHPDRSPQDRHRAAQILLSSAGVRTVYAGISVDVDGSVDHTTLGQSESLFLPTEENPWKKAWNTWWGSGLVKALEELEEDTNGTSHEGLPTQIAQYTLQYIQRLQSLYSYISPQSKMSVLELASQYSPLVDWEHCVIRAIALHPNLSYIAIARQDNRIEVKSLNNSDHKVFLRDKKQVGVVCMQWAPHCNQLLAVGATTGVLLWNVDPTAPSSRFLTTWVRFESSPGHAPITSISWSPHGNFLVSASPTDYSLITWDIPMGVATRVRRSKGGGVTEVCWSPDGQRVFAGCESSMFRVWETMKWTCEKWTNTTGRCKAACWSPKGDILLFALEGDLSLYYICFRDNELAAGSTSAIKCADLTPCTLVGDMGEEFVVGGGVQSMAWDSTGERLAVIFTADSPSNELVAVLRTRTSHLLEILPGGFIRGQDDGERPLTVKFKPGYPEGALLTTAWSSGHISFTPLCFHTSLTTPTFPPEQLTSLTSLQPTSQDTPLSSWGVGRSFPSGAHQEGRSSYHGTLYSTESFDSD